MIEAYRPGKLTLSSVDDHPDVLYAREPVVVEDSKRKRGRPRKEEKQEAVIAKNADEANAIVNKTIMTDESPIEFGYQETNDLLKRTILQSEQLASEMKMELDKVRAIKNTTAKAKYDAICGLGSTLTNLLNTKINAIRELNKSRTDAYNMEIKRYKEIGDRNAEKSTDERIQELYQAFINTPVGMYTNPHNFAPIIDATTGLVQTVPMFVNGQQPPMQNITPELNRVLIGDNPNIKTVVVSDPTTGQYGFDVIDTNTGQSVPNYPRPSQMVLESLVIKPHEGVAISKDLGQEYELYQRPSMPDMFINQSDPNAVQVMKDFEENKNKF